ncbi:hypothetical protein BKA70DRAFT_1252647 [Coprinopsis sp. MPI-PUGE-AT-0042]|nr:hypothetical protein BKA70DRAFT_1252647 [Coprinopsis sp. MPI-PUGE-AT-0042]
MNSGEQQPSAERLRRSARQHAQKHKAASEPKAQPTNGPKKRPAKAPKKQPAKELKKPRVKEPQKLPATEPKKPAWVDALSQELLVRIFAFCVQSFPDRWLTVNHVCRRWRKAAVEEPFLWSTICLNNGMHVPWVTMALKRAKDVPLDLIFSEELTPKHQTLAVKLLSEPHRLRGIELSPFLYFSNAANQKLRKKVLAMTSSLPCLETLTLYSALSVHGHVRLPANFLGGSAPNLRHLTLSHWELHSWDSPLLDNLHTLSLNNVGIPTLHGNLLNALARMKNLRSLRLSRPINSNPLHLPEGGAVAQMPRLELLDLHGFSMDSTARILRRIAFPQTARIKLDWSVDLGCGGLIRDPLSALHAAWGSTQPERPRRPIQHLLISYDNHDVTLQGWFDVGSSRRQAPIQLKLYEKGTKHSLNTMLKLFLPFTDLLQVDLNLDLWPEELAVLSQLPHVHTIMIVARAATCFLDYCVVETPSPSEAVKFPALKNLTLWNGVFYDSMIWSGALMDKNPSETHSALVRFLKARQAMGAQIDRMKLLPWYKLSEEEVAPIRELCGELECTKVDNDSDEGSDSDE